VISLVTFLVPDYDDGLRFFVDGLGWSCLADEDQGRKRWVTVAPAGGGTGLVLAQPTSDASAAALGAADRRPGGLFPRHVRLRRDAARIVAAGGRFLEDPRDEPYGRVAQWRDPWGNRWDLIQRA
jgi:predicted enzyme related to lactoylglutathione lyase